MNSEGGMRSCVSELFVAVTKIPNKNNLKEENFIWLIVLEVQSMID